MGLKEDDRAHVCSLASNIESNYNFVDLLIDLVIDDVGNDDDDNWC